MTKLIVKAFHSNINNKFSKEKQFFFLLIRSNSGFLSYLIVQTVPFLFQNMYKDTSFHLMFHCALL